MITDDDLKASSSLIDNIRWARAALAELEKKVGFETSRDWIPQSIASTGLIHPGEIGYVRGRSDYPVRPRALIVHNQPQFFDIVELAVGGESQFPFTAYPLSCSMFAHDNPPRILNFSSQSVGVDFVMHVQNTCGVPLAFKATVWGEKIR